MQRGEQILSAAHINRSELIKVAKLYYIGNMSQDRIATIIGVSRPKISRMLKMCKEKKIVEVKINTSSSSYSEIAKKIKAHFHLNDVIVAPSCPDMEDSKKNVGKAAADYLNKQLKSKTIIGITWGSTMNHMVANFHAEKSVDRSFVIQLSGGLHSQSMNLDGRELVKTLAIKLNADWLLLQTPFVVQNRLLKELLMEEPEIKRHFFVFNNIDIAFVGLGSSNPEESVTYKAGYITRAEAEYLEASGAGADICGHRIDNEGRVVSTILTDRVLSIDLETLRKIPIVVGIGAGEEKARSIIAGVKGKYINTLIIDELAAITVIGMEKIL
jgi:DNA-binding transcriptional regulator LsrR (DeoR family)